MSRRGWNGLLLVVFLALLGLNVALQPDPAVPNVEFLPEMVRTARYNAYSAHADLPGGSTLQGPVPGTIPRGYRPLHFTASPPEALRAGEELKNPFPAPDAKAVERGRFVYQNFCQACHGPSGSGNGPVAMRGFPAPPSLHAAKALDMKDGQMFHIISYGQGNMASYAAQVSRQDRWKVIAFIRALQQQEGQASSPRADARPGRPPAGGQP